MCESGNNVTNIKKFTLLECDEDSLMERSPRWNDEF
jgi:hypothetical protein